MSDVVNLENAETRLSSLIDRAAGGEEIVIARDGKPVARLVPLADGPAAENRLVQRIPGQNLLGITFISDDFDAPLPEDMMRAFRGEAD